MIARPEGGRLLVVSGPSGAGKGTVVRELLGRRPDVYLSVSATTRPVRRRERHGVDYEFMPREEFVKMRERGDFLESAEVYGNLYGTPRAPVEEALAAGRDVICELDIQGAAAVKMVKPEAILVFIEPPSLDELHKRLRNRGTEDPITMTRRVKAAYEEVKAKGHYDRIVVNDDAHRAADELLSILEA